MSSLVAADSPSSGSSSLLFFAMLALMFGFLFLTHRRRVKATQALQSTLGVGDEVTTTSGLLGRITALDEKIAILEVSPGVSIRFDRRAIAGPAPTSATSNGSRTDEQSDPASQGE